MQKRIPLHLAVEDSVSEAVLRRIIDASRKDFALPSHSIGKKGKNYLKSRIQAFNRASRHLPFIVLADLDATECAPKEIDSWLSGKPLSPNLLLRIAVREVESWILADRQAFGDFFRLSRAAVPREPDSLENAKRHLVNLVRSKSRKRAAREDIVPAPSSTAEVGRDYAGCLIRFIRDHWNINAAMANSPSLARAVRAIEQFKPVFLDRKHG